MKALLTVAIVAGAALVLGATLISTCYKPSPIIPSALNNLSTDPSFAPPLAPVQLGKAQPLQFLQPGASLTNSPLFDIPPENRGFELSKPTPLHLDKLPPPPTHLQPGVYQTHPYTIILMVPKRGIDDGILGGEPNTYSKMPIIKPHVDVIPKPFQP